MNVFSSSSSSLAATTSTSTAQIVSRLSSGHYSQDGSRSEVSQALATPQKQFFGGGTAAGSTCGLPSSLDSSVLTSENHKLSYENEKTHHGSTTSTTFSTGSTLSSTTTIDPIDYSSTASSGVATMSSSDHIPKACRHTSTSHSNSEDDSPNRNLLKVCTSSAHAPLPFAAAANSSSSTLSLNTTPASADSTLCSASTNLLLRSISPACSGTPTSSASSKTAYPTYFISSDSTAQTNLRIEYYPELGEPIAGCSTTTPASNSISHISPSLSYSQNIPSSSSMFTCGTSCSQIICTPLRTMVSQNRRRYQQDGFNLDLTYITDRIIAMGYPADTTEALYRNSMTHIVKFLEHYHPGHYKVFNLRGQYVYDTSKFHNRVISFEMTDHHPPRLELMAPFCREVHEYLEADPKNVVAVHCKAGKGRTGVMICAYLTYISFYKTPRQNMDYYSIVRTHNNKGVTIPSQRRYVYYFSHLRNKKLNYMPLRTELVGIYVEKPPKLGGSFLKGALKVRVANGDAEVFIGGDLWLSVEKSEEEEEMHRQFPVMVGEDQFDPNHPQPGKDCISRRCYGWTVPSNARVFLEGDVRIDLFQKSQLQLAKLKLKQQEKKKIGHIWMNTMFSCPGFCGGQYVHGDEAYPYNDENSMIVRKERRSKTSLLRDSTHTANTSLPSSPPCPEAEEKGMTHKISAPASFDARGTAKMALNFNEIPKKRSGKSPCSHVIESEKIWMSQDSEHTRSKTTKEFRGSLDTTDLCHYDQDIIIESPPGLERHCPVESLQAIYQSEKQAPRHGIVDILKMACEKDLIKDKYNDRRGSVPTKGAVMPKAPAGRPQANGPYCVMRQKEEHVSIYGVQEIDRAHKGKELDMAFKVYIVTRCINEGNLTDVKKADDFLKEVYKKQMLKDSCKKEKVELRQKKLFPSCQQPGSTNCSALPSEGVDRQQSGSNGFTDSSSSSHLSCNSTPDLSQQTFLYFGNDPRLTDPHLKKFFFRQRINSQSKHPNFHYHCPAQNQDPLVCSKHGCSKKRQRHNPNSSKTTSITDRPSLYVDNEADVEDDTDVSCFDDFDFFRPNSFEKLKLEEVDGFSDSSVGRTPVDLNSLGTVIPTRSATMTSATVADNAVKEEALKFESRSRSARSSSTVDKFPSSNAMITAQVDEANHPSDCSWASSSSSTPSSSHSLTYPT